jgi:hypothetical protein
MNKMIKAAIAESIEAAKAFGPVGIDRVEPPKPRPRVSYVTLTRDEMDWLLVQGEEGNA